MPDLAEKEHWLLNRWMSITNLD